MSRPIASATRVRCLAELIRQELALHLDGDGLNKLLLDPLREQCPQEYQIGASDTEIRLAIIRALALVTIDFQEELVELRDRPSDYDVPELDGETWARVSELLAADNTLVNEIAALQQPKQQRHGD